MGKMKKATEIPEGTSVAVGEFTSRQIVSRRELLRRGNRCQTFVKGYARVRVRILASLL